MDKGDPIIAGAGFTAAIMASARQLK